MPRVVLSPEERLGTLLAGKYRFERVLGQGGMGTVFGGTHTWTNRSVAIKVLNDAVASDPGIAERFLWEARAAAEIRHPNVVDVLDMGTGDDGAVYMVLEWLEGESLADTLERERPMRLERAIRYLAPIMAALAHAHAAGIVHRDIKPENIFISKDKLGRTVPKLLDFGVAKVRQRTHEKKDNRTETGTVIGTPQYMSPEQAMGDTDVGPPADVWSIGAVLFECLTGQLPFGERTSAALLIALNTQDAPSIVPLAPNLPADVAAVIDRALRRRRDQRWESMTDMLGALVKACEQADVPIDDATRSVLSALDPSVGSPSLPPLPPEDAPPPMPELAQPAPADVPLSGFDGPSKRQTRPLRPPVEGGAPVTPMTMSREATQAAVGPASAAAAQVAPERPTTGFSWSGQQAKPRSSKRLAAIVGLVIVVPLAALGVFTLVTTASTTPSTPSPAPAALVAPAPREPPAPADPAPTTPTPSVVPAPAEPTEPAPAPNSVATASADAGMAEHTSATSTPVGPSSSPASPRPRSRGSRLIRTW